MGTSLKFLDQEYKERRKGDKGTAATMRADWHVEVWPEEVPGGDLLEQMVRRIRRHVVMDDEAALAVALWIMFAWMHEATVHSPILMVCSPEAECGKTTLLGLTNFMVPRGFLFVEVSAAVLYRMVEKWHPTLLVDEADKAFDRNPELRAVINSGWTRGVGVPRCNHETNEPEFFETFGPKAIGLKGLNVPDTTLSRSIIIDMQRKLPGDTAEDFAHADDKELLTMRRKLARFAADNMHRLGKPKLPEGFSNRLAANWRMLLAIAELCGKGDEARGAATFLSGRSDEASLGVELLRDIREIFVKADADRIKSKDLVAELTALEDRPWGEMPDTLRPINQNGVARMLKPFKVKPRQVRFGNNTFKGYQQGWFERAFRYIPECVERQGVEKRGNVETTAENSQKSRNISEQHVSAKTAENDQCFGVSPFPDPLAPPSEIVAFEERAAILEYDGGS